MVNTFLSKCRYVCDSCEIAFELSFSINLQFCFPCKKNAFTEIFVEVLTKSKPVLLICCLNSADLLAIVFSFSLNLAHLNRHFVYIFVKKRFD